MFETKYVGGSIIETKQGDQNGQPVGIVEGYIASFTPDQGGVFGKPDKFHPGAFLKSIAEHKARNNRPIRLRDHHGRTIGGFPIETVKEDTRGLFGRGEINLNVVKGAEAYALAQQGVLTDFSIGFIAKNDRLGEFRDIYEAEIIEGSIVDDPLNRDAQITEVKAQPFQDSLQMASLSHHWNEESALVRVREYTGADETITTEYKSCFLYWDTDGKYPIADVIDDDLIVIPKAVMHAAQSLLESDLEDGENKSIVRTIEQYYARMHQPSPFKDGDKCFWSATDIKSMDRRNVEAALIKSGAFSKKAAVMISLGFNEHQAEANQDWSSVMSELRSIGSTL